MAKRVLVVDDHPLLREVQVLLLREAGYAATALPAPVRRSTVLPISARISSCSI